MSQPPYPYNRIFDFESFSINTPAAQQPGVQLEGEYDAIKRTIDGLISRLAEIQRDDGKLRGSAFDLTTQGEIYAAILVLLQPTLALKANLASPALTGTPTAPTPATNSNNTNIATTAFVKAQGYATTTSLNNAINGVESLVDAVDARVDATNIEVSNKLDKRTGGVIENGNITLNNGGLILNKNLYTGSGLIEFKLNGQTTLEINEELIILHQIAYNNFQTYITAGSIFLNSTGRLENLRVSVDAIELESTRPGFSGNVKISLEDNLLKLSKGIKFPDNTSQSSAFIPADYATNESVDTKIANLVNSAPETLDTLGEIADALGNDANLATTLTNSIATKLPLAGGEMTGELSMGGYNITNVVSANIGQIVFQDDTIQNTAGLPLTGGIMSGAIRFDTVGNQSISKGSFDSGRGAHNGISLICANDVELNWQDGYLRAMYQGQNVAIKSESDIVFPAVQNGADSAIGNWGFGVEYDMGPGGDHQQAYIEHNIIAVEKTDRSTSITPSDITMYADYEQVKITANGGASPVFTLKGEPVNYINEGVNQQNLAYLNLSLNQLTINNQPNAQAESTRTLTLNPGELNVIDYADGLYWKIGYNGVDIYAEEGGYSLNRDGIRANNGVSKLEFAFAGSTFLIDNASSTFNGNITGNSQNILFSDTFHNKVTDSDYKKYSISANNTDGITLLHEKNIAPGATLTNSITINAANGVKINGVEIVRADTQTFARKDGATFSGKVNLGAGATIAPLNIGTGVTPSSSVNGDIWIATDTLNYKNSTGTIRTVATLGNNNPFTNYQSISVSNNSNPALKITQLGTGEALRVEDETSPDATAFVVSNNGRVGIGVAPDATVALTVDSTGIKVNGMVIVPATTVTNSPITSGNMSHAEYPKELIVTLAGVQYAIPLRVV